MTLKYFVRTDESIPKAQKAMERNRSIRRWAFAGAHPEEHFLFGITNEERVQVINKMGFEVETEEEAVQVFQSEVEGLMTDDLIKALNLAPMDAEPGDYVGYAEFLQGLCALEGFENKPTPADCSEDLHGELFPYLVCYEGEYVGDDPDEGWPLFQATKIVWVHETGQAGKRVRLA